MTKLIPLDAAIDTLTELSCDDNAHWGAIIDTIRTIPAIDPAAIREAALREAVKSLRDWQSDLNRHLLMDTAVIVGIAADVVEALIGEKK